MANKQIIRVTAHHVDNYDACPLYFHRVTNLEKGSPSTPSRLARGTAIHKLLEYYYKGVQASIDFDTNVTAAVANFEVDAVSINGLLVEDIDLVISTFHDYTQWYQERDNFTVLTVEEKLSKVLFEDDSVTMLYEGKLDMNVLSPEGVILPYDHKSESAKFVQSAMSNQFMGYCYLTDQPRMIRNAIGFQKTKGPADKFYRTMYSYSAEKIAWWKDVTIKKVFNILHSYATDTWEPRLSSCDTLHKAGCPFRDVCVEPEDMWAEKLEQDYVHVELYDRR